MMKSHRPNRSLRSTAWFVLTGMAAWSPLGCSKPKPNAEQTPSAALEKQPDVPSSAAPTASGPPPSPEPVVQVLATGLSNPGSIALGPSSVFVAAQGVPTDVDDAAGEIGAVPKEGGAFSTLVAKQPFPNTLATDGTSVYWATLDSAFSAPVAGGEAKRLYKVRGSGGVHVAGVDDKDVFLVFLRGMDQGAILRVSKAGGAPRDMFRGEGVVHQFAVESQYVVFCTTGLVVIPKQNPAAARVVEMFAPSVCDSIAVDGSSVYWSVRSSLYRSDLSDGAPVKLGEDGGAKYLAASGKFIYLAREESSDSWQIGRVPTVGGGVEVLIDGLAGVDALAVDASHIYWLNRGAGTLSRASLSKR